MKKIAVVIIAAGSSSRMKTAKQLLPFGKTSLLGKAIEEAKACTADEVLVVLGANMERIKPEIAHYNCTIIENKDWEKGMGVSIATGIKHVIEKEDFEAVLLMTGDQPLIDASYLDKLLAEFRKGSSQIIATDYPGSIGVPALFPKEYFTALSRLDGDRGAKSLLRNKENPVLVLDAGNKILDLDTPEDYREILGSFSEKDKK